jgi:hypothetical protein
MKKFLLFTYDYELFLGRRSGTVTDCQIRPTDATLDILGRYQARAIFFVDTLHLVRLKEIAESGHADAQNDWLRLTAQIQKIISLGHDVFPHIHPHWLDAVYNRQTGQWDLSDVRHYRFHQCSPEIRRKVFMQSLHLLEEIIHPVNTRYRIEGFRAGGWCIQPFSDFKDLMAESGIRYEMSVLPGFYSFTHTQHFDFTMCPEKRIYRFEDDECREERAGRFVQLTISSMEMPPLYRLLDRGWQAFSSRFLFASRAASGIGHLPVPLKPQPLPRQTGYNILQNHRQRLAIELITPVSLPLYKKFLRQHHYMHFLSHPKMIAPLHHYYFQKFLDHAFNRYQVSTDFRRCVQEHNVE